jgi:hypothetical protein
MKKRKSDKPKRYVQVGNLSRSGGKTLKSYTVGAVPILNHIIKRARIEEFLRQYLREDDRCTIAPSVCTVVLLKNYPGLEIPITPAGDHYREGGITCRWAGAVVAGEN